MQACLTFALQEHRFIDYSMIYVVQLLQFIRLKLMVQSNIYVILDAGVFALPGVNEVNDQVNEAQLSSCRGEYCRQ